MATSHERRSQAARIGNKRRIQRYGSCFSPESQSRGGSVSCHLRWHAEKFNSNCLICLEELLQEQIAFFKKFEN